MRTASHRVRALTWVVLAALSAVLVVLRRRRSAGRPLAAALPGPPPYVPEPAAAVLPEDVLATDAGLTEAEPPGPTAARHPGAEAEEVPAGVEPDVLATDAGLTEAEPPGPTGARRPEMEAEEVPAGVEPDVLATDAGLTETERAGTVAEDLPAGVIADLGSAEAPRDADDLRAIRGVGPSIERALHGLGITTYRQVAVLDGDELERVRASLHDFRARIEREDWIGQARELHRAKYGEQL